jgi:hypothetical protein
MKIFKPKSLKINDKRIINYQQIYFENGIIESDNYDDIIPEVSSIAIVFDGYDCKPNKNIVLIKFSFIVSNNDLSFNMQVSIPVKITAINSTLELDTSNNIDGNRLMISAIMPFTMTSHFYRDSKDSYHIIVRHDKPDSPIKYLRLNLRLQDYVFMSSILSSLYNHREMNPMTNAKLIVKRLSYKCISTIPFNIEVDIQRITYNPDKKHIILLAECENFYMVVFVGAKNIYTYALKRLANNTNFIDKTKFSDEVSRITNKPVIYIKDTITAYFIQSDKIVESCYFLSNVSTATECVHCIEFRKIAYDSFISNIKNYIYKLCKDDTK